MEEINLNIFDKNQRSINQLDAEFKSAEKWLKLMERRKIIDGLDIGTITELNDASYHLVEALLKKDAESQDAEIHNAIRYCKRAGFEALQGGVITRLMMIKDLRKEFKGNQISKVIPDWYKINKRYKEIIGELERINASDNDKAQYFDYVNASYLEVCGFTDGLGAYVQELRNSRRQQRYGRVSVWVLSVTSILTVVLNILLYIIN